MSAGRSIRSASHFFRRWPRAQGAAAGRHAACRPVRSQRRTRHSHVLSVSGSSPGVQIQHLLGFGQSFATQNDIFKSIPSTKPTTIHVNTYNNVLVLLQLPGTHDDDDQVGTIAADLGPVRALVLLRVSARSYKLCVLLTP